MDETNEDGDYLCPLCMEEMDLTDRHLRPCHCGYQICVWCWHQIMELAGKDNTEGRCPACRTPYDKEKIVGAASNCEELIDLAADKKRPHKVKIKSSDGRKHLSNVRVVQRNLVYVVGFPLHLADEETLEKREYFGQYGRILKVAMSRSSSYNGQHSHNGPSASVYVTFVREEDALRCIRAVDGCILEGKLLRACFGTNKYCNAWLKNMPCNNPDCLYLHDEGTEEDSFTKEEMLAKYGSKHQHFNELTHPPHRVLGAGLPPPIPEASTALCASVSGLQHIQHQTPRVLGKASISSAGPGKATSLPAAASWGMRGKAPATKATTNTSILKKKSSGVICTSSCSSSTSSNSPLSGVAPTASGPLVETSRVASAVEDQCMSSSSNLRSIRSDALHYAHIDTENYDTIEPFATAPESAYSSTSSVQLNVGDVSISLGSSPTELTIVHDEILDKLENFHLPSVNLERIKHETEEETTLVVLSTPVEKKRLNEGENLQESSIVANDLSNVEDNLLQIAMPTKAGAQNLSQFRGDNSIISDILTMDFNEDGSFSSPADLAKLLRAGTLDPLVPDCSKDSSMSWKSPSSSQSRFSFARLKDREQLHGVPESHLASSGDNDRRWIDTTQMHLPATLNSVRQFEPRMDVASASRNDHESSFDHDTGIQTELSKPQTSLDRHEFLDYRNEAQMYTTEFTVPLMSTTKARLHAPPGFSMPTKVSSVYPPGFSFQNPAERPTFHGLIDESQVQDGVSSGVFGTPLSNQNISDVELIDPAIMAVGRGKSPLNAGQVGPRDAGQVVSSVLDRSQFHHLFTKGTSSTNTDPFGLGPSPSVSHSSGISDLDILLKRQQQRAGFADGKYYSLPYPLERHHNNDQDSRALSPLSSGIIDGALSARMFGHHEENFTSPMSQTSAFPIGPNSFLNLTRASMMGSLEQNGLETSELDAYHPTQRLNSHLRSSTAINRLGAGQDGSRDSLNFETAVKNLFLSSTKQDFSRINFDRYSGEQSLQSPGSVSRLDFNGKPELDRRW
ncbi:hypothetical protein O6H91_21G007100 [Diphasiastrum complanatum]|uniref:Uncharacterized protein n=1 Tax=Diphasiastrum complanatum TaxID=34168 RepID=A0ACC2AHB6_DIPCM|nr:hypothetical protein O6H91_21G007100 [Diphasiastrum complanatum]